MPGFGRPPAETEDIYFNFFNVLFFPVIQLLPNYLIPHLLNSFRHLIGNTRAADAKTGSLGIIAKIDDDRLVVFV